MFSKLRTTFEMASRNFGEDPASRGAAKMTAGAALIAEGTFGAISRLSDAANPFDRRDNGRGIVGAFLGVVIGLVFVVAGLVVAPDRPADEVSTTGTVVDVSASRTSDGDRTYSPVIEYTDADGTSRTFTQSMSSSSRPTVGDTVQVGYSAARPDQARRLDGIAAHVHWWIIGVGAVVALAALWSFLVKAAMIVIGCKLFFSGRRERDASGTADSFLTDLMDLFRDKDQLAEALR